MNKELLQLFDIKDDDVKAFTVDNKDSNYEINIRFKPSRTCCSNCGSFILLIKAIKKVTGVYTYK